jgi:tyrosyl-tRNA synthetase
MTRTFLDELAWRGLLFQSTEGAQRALAGTGIVGYCGFDPTAPSSTSATLSP